MAMPARLRLGLGRRNGDIAASGSRKREHIGRPVLAAKLAVQLLHFRVSGKQDADFAAHSGGALRLPGKAAEGYQWRAPADLRARCNCGLLHKAKEGSNP